MDKDEKKDRKTKRDSGNKALGERVRMLLKKAGVSQKTLSAATGIPQPNISQLLNGRQLIGDARLALVAEHLGITLEDLVGTTAKGSLVSPGRSVNPDWEQPIAARLPTGLAGFLERNAAKLQITQEDIYHLTQTRFSTKPWVIRDDTFWEKALRILREINAPQPIVSSSPGSPEETKPGRR